ncbi:hypothetical protein, partial [Allgaiera indica]
MNKNFIPGLVAVLVLLAYAGWQGLRPGRVTFPPPESTADLTAAAPSRPSPMDRAAGDAQRATKAAETAVAAASVAAADAARGTDAAPATRAQVQTARAT